MNKTIMMVLTNVLPEGVDTQCYCSAINPVDAITEHGYCVAVEPVYIEESATLG